jgi:hypothetical protein
MALYMADDEEETPLLYPLIFNRDLTEYGRESRRPSHPGFNAPEIPMVALDPDGFVVQVNAAARALFDDDINVKDRRLWVRDPEAMALLKYATPPNFTAPMECVIVRRQDKLTVVVRIMPCGTPHRYGWGAVLTLIPARRKIAGRPSCGPGLWGLALLAGAPRTRQ